MTEPGIVCERRGAAGFALLNRPQSLNALNLAMLRGLHAALAAWAEDAAVERVVITGAGDRAFCAGGDIRQIYEWGRAGDHAQQLAFWREEYQLNRLIARYPKPYVALIDGFDMGGGMGVSMLGSHRIVGDKAMLAMPEVAIGFIPDVGATWFLPRLASGVGAWLAMSGARLNAGDACAFGLATGYTPTPRFGALEQGLEARGDVAAILADFAAEPPASKLAAHLPTIRACFGAGSVAGVLSCLGERAARGEAFAAQTLASLATKSPTSVALALRQMQVGRGIDIEAALQIELRIAARVCRGVDLYEGVRAAVVDKTHQPQWSPARHEDVDEAVILAHFDGIGADELTFEKANGSGA